MVKRYILTTMVILTMLTVTSAVVDTTPPDSISKLYANSYGTTYIDWGWIDPTISDFNHVDIYINGKFKASVSKGIKHYKATGLIPDTKYKISTHTVDNSENVNETWKNSSKKTAADSSTIRFITVGDPHLTSNTSKNEYKNFTRVVNYINNRTDIDFVVVMGDIVDTASIVNFATAKSILNNLSKPYYVVEGNHDMGTIPGKNFRTYIGPTEHIENINGYQLIFVGINRNGTKNANGTLIEYDWIFNYSTADKNKPTIIFSHGPVQPKPGGTCSNWDSNASKEVYFSYACSMKPEIDKFTNLFGYYSGHVHTGTNQTINGVLYVVEDNIGGNGVDSVYIGYTVIQNGIVTYSLVRY